MKEYILKIIKKIIIIFKKYIKSLVEYMGMSCKSYLYNLWDNFCTFVWTIIFIIELGDYELLWLYLKTKFNLDKYFFYFLLVISFFIFLNWESYVNLYYFVIWLIYE